MPTISISLVGSLSRSTMLPASRAATVPVFIATPTSACAKCRGIVGAVAAHGDKLAFRLFVADERQLVFRCCLGEEIVDAGFRGDGGRRQRIVARDHHRADTHAAQLGETLTNAALDDVLEVNDAKQLAVADDRKRRAAGLGDLVGDCLQIADGFGTGAAQH